MWFFISVLFFTHVGYSKTIVLSGVLDGGDPRSNQYVTSHKNELIKYSNQNHFDFRELGASSVCPNCLPFSSENFNEEINGFIAKIGSGQITSNDQIMISVMGHGGSRGQEFSHTLSDSESSINLDLLQKLKSATEAKGIQLAVIDQSCFSGNSLELRGPHTCVISSTSENGYSWDQHLNFFSHLNLKGKNFSNLEEAFLSARKRSSLQIFPRISTDADNYANTEIDLMKNILADERRIYDGTGKFDCSETSSAGQLNKLVKNISELSIPLLTALNNQSGKNIDPQRVQKVVNETLRMRNSNLDDLRRFSDEFQTQYCSNGDCASYGEIWKTRVRPSPRETAAYKLYDQALLDPKFRQFALSADIYKTYRENLIELVEMERSLYDFYYQKGNAISTSNPCHDFRL